MYGYEEYIDLVPEQILQKVTQEEIFEFILEAPFDIRVNYCSTLRDDKKPGCRFEERPDGTILFVDFGERFLSGKTHRNCFTMVMDRFNVSLAGAIRIICSEFGLSTDKRDYKATLPQKTQYQKQDSSSTELNTIIRYDIKQPVKSDILFWSQFLIKIDEFLEDGNFCINRFSVRNHKGYFTFQTFKYSYALDFIDRVKIYQPYKGKYKWVTNCDENCIGNFDNLPPTGDSLIIQKSYKDHRVLRNLNLGYNVIWFQNEGCVPSLEILKNLTERFKEIIVFYDNDEDGTLAAIKLVDILNSIREDCARMVHLPVFINKGITWKDPSQFINKEGRRDTITVLKQIGL